MPARIFCKLGELKGVQQEFEDEIVLGRSSKSSLQLNAAMISARHLRIAYHPDPGVYLLEDLGSTNGTHLDGIRVREPRPLGHLHVITLAGAYNFIFQDLERCARRHGRDDRDGDRSQRLRQPEEEPLQMRTMLQKTLPDFPAAIAVKQEEDDSPLNRTRIDRQVPILPALLAHRGKEEPEFEDDPAERTSLGLELPLQLPDFLNPSPPAPETTEPQVIAETVDLDEAVAALSAPAESAAESAPGSFSHSQVADLMLGTDRRRAGLIELELLLADGTLKRFPLPEGKSVLGRGAEATLQVISLEVSRLHAEFVVEAGRVRVRDLGSRNRTYVNDVETSGAVEVPRNAALRFGRLTGRLIYSNAADASTEASTGA